MRIGWGLLVVVLACGNQQSVASPTPSATPPPTASASPEPSATPSAAPSETASAAPTAPPAPPMKTVQETLASAKSIKVTWRPKLDSNESKGLDVKTPATIKQIVDAIGGEQRPEGPGPGYMSTLELKFIDQGGNPLATVSLFASETMSDSNKKYGRINVADGTYGGITVAKYADLQRALKGLGVALP